MTPRSKRFITASSPSGLKRGAIRRSLSRSSRIGAMERSVRQLVEAALSLPACRGLDLNGCRGLMDIGWLKEFLALTYVELDGCDQIRDFSPLAGLKNLRWLIANLCMIGESPDWLSGLHKLETLWLERCPGLADLTPFRDLTSLRSLLLTGNAQLTDLSPLQSLAKLRLLNCTGCSAITDLTALRRLTNLSELLVLRCPAVPQSQIVNLSHQLPNCGIKSDHGNFRGGKEVSARK